MLDSSAILTVKLTHKNNNNNNNNNTINKIVIIEIHEQINSNAVILFLKIINGLVYIYS